MVGGEFQVNTETSAGQRAAVVAGLEDGGYVVAWHSNGQDASGWGIFAQRFDAAGAPVDQEFRVNDTTASSQTLPSITALNTGGFVITWQDDGAADGSGTGVFGQQYDASGNRLDSQFQVNTETASTQHQTAITALDNGGFAVGWSSNTQRRCGVMAVAMACFINSMAMRYPRSPMCFASGSEDQPIVSG